MKGAVSSEYVIQSKINARVSKIQAIGHAEKIDLMKEQTNLLTIQLDHAKKVKGISSLNPKSNCNPNFNSV